MLALSRPQQKPEPPKHRYRENWWANGSEAPHLCFGLCLPQIFYRFFSRFRRAKHGTKAALDLRKAQHRLGRYILIVRQQRGDYVNRTGALAKRELRIAVGLHASKNVVGARFGRVVVELSRHRACAAGNQAERQQKTDARRRLQPISSLYGP